MQIALPCLLKKLSACCILYLSVNFWLFQTDIPCIWEAKFFQSLRQQMTEQDIFLECFRFKFSRTRLCSWKFAFSLNTSLYPGEIKMYLRCKSVIAASLPSSNGELNAFWLLSLKLRMGKFIQRLWLSCALHLNSFPWWIIHGRCISFKQRCFKLFQTIDWSLHGFNQKHRLSAHIKRPFPVCERAVESENGVQMWSKFFMVLWRFSWNILHDRLVMYEEHISCGWDTEEEKVNLVIYERKARKVFEAFAVKSLNIPCIVDWTNNPFCIQAKTSRWGRFLRLQPLSVKSIV